MANLLVIGFFMEIKQPKRKVSKVKIKVARKF